MAATIQSRVRLLLAVLFEKLSAGRICTVLQSRYTASFSVFSQDRTPRTRGDGRNPQRQCITGRRIEINHLFGDRGGVMTTASHGCLCVQSQRWTALVAAVGCALIGLVASNEPARAQRIGDPCTTADGQPGTFEPSTDPFTGVTTIVCSASFGPGRGALQKKGGGLPFFIPWWEFSPGGPEPNADDPRLYWYNWWNQIVGGFGGDFSGNRLGGPVEFKLFGSEGTSSGVYGAAGVASAWNSGYRVTDTAGALPANSLAPGYRASSSVAGANLTVDGTRLFDLNGNQQLLFGLTFDYRRTDTEFGTSALTPAVTSAGSVRRNDYTLAGTVDYRIDTIYFSGRAAVDWGRADITNVVLSSQGNTTGSGYQLSATAGKVFPLFNSTGVNPAMFVKAPPRSAGGYAVFLDVNGRLGYLKMRDNGFVDSSGFIYGTELVSYWTVSARANLVAAIPTGRATWMPYLGVTFDQQIDFRHTFDIPAQAAAAADQLSFAQGRTWWGVQGGVSIFDRGGIKAGLNAYYRASSDTSILGGSLSLKVPFFVDAVAPAARDSGIRVLSK
jgi:hypothetical protein